ncbi:DEAD/DEAH box helicase [Fictibacillus sp. NPDC058756]|uniref:DEAD/DEAH box helicase n=1 Tax=Fictibacillus sp. NPDC058756 TaxID=3346625 RepID=UPI0036AA9BE0
MPLICPVCIVSNKPTTYFYQISRQFKATSYRRKIVQATNGLHKKEWVHELNESQADGLYCTECNNHVIPDLLSRDELELLKDNRIETWNPSEFPIDDVLQKLMETGRKNGSGVEHYSFPERTAIYGELKKPLPDIIYSRLREMGIKELYSHQADAINEIRDGKNVVIETGTASGKSLIFTLPVLEKLLEAEDSTVLYLSPLKALTHDQLKGLDQWNEVLNDDRPLHGFKKINIGGKEICAGVLEGGEGDSAKELTYENARYWMTNVHYLHLLLQGPYHYPKRGKQCYKFFTNLKYVVLDELHAYNGVLGSKVSMVIRRLRMLCRKFGNTNIQFITCSASIGNPKELSEEITGLKGIKGFSLINHDGSPTNKREILLWNPGLLETQTHDRTRRAPISEAIEILKNIVDEFNILPKTLMFYGNRRATSTASFDLNRAIRSRYQEKGLGENLPSELFTPFHAQLTTMKKHQLMNRLKQDELVGLVSTSALEMGIDIGDLSLCIMVGYGGSKASFLQQAGRVGRKGPGLVIQIFQEDPLEQYYATNPKEFIEREAEHVTIDVENSNIISEHLKYAAFEQNGSLSLPQSFFRVSAVRKMEEFNEIWKVEEPKWKLQSKEKLKYNYLLNSGKVYKVVLKTGHKSETIFNGVDERSLLRDYHYGAVFLYEDKTYKVHRINSKTCEIQVIQQRFDYTTRSQIADTISLIDEYKKEDISQKAELGLGKFEITRRLWGFKKVALFGGQINENIQESNMYPVKYTTNGLWIKLSNQSDDLTEGSIHVLEHAIASAIPTIVKCATSDFGLLSSVNMKEFSFSPTVVIYETGGGGAGIVDAVQKRFIDIMDKALAILKACPCNNGCPNCTHISSCERGNDPLNKDGGIILLEKLLKNTEKFVKEKTH